METRQTELTSIGLLARNGDLAILTEHIDVSAEVAQDLQGQVTKGPLRLLERLARVALGKGDAEVLADLLEPVLARKEGAAGVDLRRGTGEGVQVGDEMGEVIVGSVRLESELVLEGHSEGDDEVGAGPGNRQFG